MYPLYFLTIYQAFTCIYGIFFRRATSPLRHLWEGVHSGQHPQHAPPHSRRAEGLHPNGGRNLARGQRPHRPERYTGQLLAPHE